VEENGKNEQYLEVNEEQLHVVTGAGEPSFKTSPIGANRAMAHNLLEKAHQAHQRGFTSLAETITENAMKHLERADQLEADKVAGKRPISESSPSPSPKPSTSINENRGIRIR
jgi:hypothetical protein